MGEFTCASCCCYILHLIDVMVVPTDESNELSVTHDLTMRCVCVCECVCEWYRVRVLGGMGWAISGAAGGSSPLGTGDRRSASRQGGRAQRQAARLLALSTSAPSSSCTKKPFAACVALLGFLNQRGWVAHTTTSRSVFSSSAIRRIFFEAEITHHQALLVSLICTTREDVQAQQGSSFEGH